MLVLLSGQTQSPRAASDNKHAAQTAVHMARLGALSAVGRSHTFEAAADGYGRGEGCIALALRAARDAGAPQALAVLCGARPQQCLEGDTLHACTFTAY